VTNLDFTAKGYERMRIKMLRQGSPEWHAWRREGIGGSDAPVVEGISPYRTPRQLALEKRGQDVDAEEDDNEFIFSKGHRTEGVIRAQFRELTGAEMTPLCVEHPELAFVRASLDGFDDKFGILEGKLVGQAVLEAARGGEIPAHHFSQIQHQYAVLGDVDRAQWFGHDGKKSGVLVEVKRDNEYIKRLLDKEHQFWEMLKSGGLPALTDRDYLVPDDQRLLHELREAKEFAENAQAAYEIARAKAARHYGHVRIQGAGIKLLKSTRQGSIDLLAVPEIAAAVEAVRQTLPLEHIEKFRKKSSESWSVRIETKTGSSE
jgi:putative phage-type endonuclease